MSGDRSHPNRAFARGDIRDHPAGSTVNNHLASLSAFTMRGDTQAPRLVPAGDPAKGIEERRLPPLERRAPSKGQVSSVKNGDGPAAFTSFVCRAGQRGDLLAVMSNPAKTESAGEQERLQPCGDILAGGLIGPVGF